MTPLQQLVEDWQNCDRCELHETRRNVVLGKGTVPCDILLIGQAPGRSEDALGEVFVGPAGSLLEEILDTACSYFPNREFTRAFTNIVACMPPKPYRGPHEPSKECARACRPRLKRFVELCRPKLVVLVGAVAVRYTKPDAKVLPDAVPKVEVVHPSYILQSPVVKQHTLRKGAVISIRDAINRHLVKGDNRT